MSRRDTVFIEFGIWMLFAVLTFVLYEILAILIPHNTALWYWLIGSIFFLIFYLACAR